MDYINYVKQSPIAGFSGFGGGATGLNFASAGVTPVGPYNGDRGIVGGGGGGGLVNNISYTTISTSGSWSDFGDMNQSLYGPDGVSGGDGELGEVQASRGLIWGGDVTGSHVNTNTIQYLATATTANTQDFGDLTADLKLSAGNFSNGWRCCYCGGGTNGREPIDYVATMTTGNAQDFGDLPASAGSGGSGQVQNGTNGFSFKFSNTAINVNTIDTTGNATSFGSLSSTIGNNQGCGSNLTYGLHSGTNSEFGIDRFTMATSGNGTDVGNLSANRWGSGGCSNMNYLLVVAGYDDGNNINSTEYRDFSSSGNASNFGNLNYTKRGLAGLSGAAS